MKQKMIVGIILLSCLVAGCTAYTCLPEFGSIPKNERKRKVHGSPNYRDGRFQNIQETPQLTERFWNAIFQSSSKRKTPESEISTVKTSLAELNPQENLLVWFGHSSYYFQVEGKRFLVDPVFSHYASPVSFINRAFKGTNVFKAADIPAIDYLVITHDHWDHLDYPTVKELKPRIRNVICPLGVGAHFARWHFDESAIIEMDWEDKVLLDSRFEIYCLPARHFSGRGFINQKQSLWASFLLKSAALSIYMGGDSGYGAHFASIGERFGPIDFALLENGQYNKAWKYIHMEPEETWQAAIDLQAKNIIPVHHSKFALSRHSWDEPLIRINEAGKEQETPRLLTPLIGEIVFLKDTMQTFNYR
jgi:L-ascorbate metabolism protein UlaG (beta-lactamase superfamily)